MPSMSIITLNSRIANYPNLNFNQTRPAFSSNVSTQYPPQNPSIGGGNSGVVASNLPIKPVLDNSHNNDKKASCLELKPVGGGNNGRDGNKGRYDGSTINNGNFVCPNAPKRLSPHPQSFQDDITLSSLTLDPSSSVSSFSIPTQKSSNASGANPLDASLYVDLSNVPNVEWASMPLSPVQGTRLSFGLGTRQAPVGSEIHQIVTLVNTSRHKQHFRFCPNPSSKCAFSADPQEGRVDPGKEVCVVVTAAVLCTARFGFELPLVVWRHKGRHLMQASFVGDIESQLTTKLDADELVLRTPPVGEGSFGTTYRGEYRGTDVAVKVIKYQNDITPKMISDFKKETTMLEKLRHPCIIGFIGAVHNPGSFAIVTEFAEFGSLSNLIRGGALSYPQKLKALLDISNGMRYLHNSNIIHRDLKPANVLVVSKEVSSGVMCKLSDFGSTRDINKFLPELALTRCVGTPIFMAPELIAGKNDYNKSADVYSFAMTMVNVISEKFPFEGEALAEPWHICVLSNIRPRMVGCCVPDDYYTLMKLCWSANPDDRPDFDFVVKSIGEMLCREIDGLKK